ncbi:hypothetical protein PtrSN002B_003296 [Pyrenophora tritici-repentis]|uniref:FAP domain containing protein n=2 Tax=Pyrenophora tritici-repentis TaxID=45151 RepID=A0A2W1D7V3_9PLEO|nr:uncharacterized protein PTRG_10956 [Pyrenophora tritici-repentis Pt-1C-BFP]KAA8618135.1 hypothetical protein PtrV1_09642 [Pyrenophora tritici-repentis]EDU44006.1 predicted protein [Pyrenophora tritici-repentis Pt-1C-BFP]KAF7442905.1 hypothetical protein A1F99_124120 [Pyrenophora tritici-repentis]KAF7568636.1 FAP domain containing protein [Pyrenophora tritici-repentis]KAG9376418.1 hypothetical protein A1F94_012965 [Pyrenophora tritici-repentis]
MQPITFLTAALLTLTTTASPLLATEEKRQVPEGAPRVYARFYGDGGCNTAWLEDTVFLQSGTRGLAGCQDLTVGPFASTFFDYNNFNATVRFFNLPCSQLTSVNSGNHIDIAPGAAPGCKALAIRSWITL